MRFIYTFIFYLLTPFILLRLYWKSRRFKAYADRIQERFFRGKCLLTEPVDVWIHAVSLGEAIAATPIILGLLDRKWRVMVTTMTPSGSEYVQKRFGEKVAHQYLPYDLPRVMRRFFKQLKPRCGIIMETELWPNLINCARKNNIPLLLMNARISPRAYKKYLRARIFFKPILNQLTLILAQSKEDAERYIYLGASSERVTVAGNIKYDVQPLSVKTEMLSTFKKAWGEQRVVLVIASTHHDEESQILDFLPMFQKRIPHFLLLIVPRHPERFQMVYRLCCDRGFQVALRSEPESIQSSSEIVVVDSLGELSLFYALSHYAFVGGSLVPIGGHNVLEPIALQVPVFCGPFMNNFKAIRDDLVNANALGQVQNAEALVERIATLHHDQALREKQIQNATAVLIKNQGALSQCLQAVDELISVAIQ